MNANTDFIWMLTTLQVVLKETKITELEKKKKK